MPNDQICRVNRYPAMLVGTYRWEGACGMIEVPHATTKSSGGITSNCPGCEKAGALK